MSHDVAEGSDIPYDPSSIPGSLNSHMAGRDCFPTTRYWWTSQEPMPDVCSNNCYVSFGPRFAEYNLTVLTAMAEL